MKKILLFTIALVHLEIYAQYTHFNTHYTDPDGIGAQHWQLFMKDSLLVSLGMGGIFPDGGLVAHESTLNGALVHSAYTITSTLGFGIGGGGLWRDAMLHDGDKIYSPTGTSAYSEGWVYGYSGLAKFADDYSVEWYIPFDQWTIDSVVWFGAGLCCDYDDTTLCFSSVGAYRASNVGNPDSLSWRLTRISKENGAIISDYNYVHDVSLLTKKQIRKIGNNYFILGSSSNNNPYTDTQIVLIKTDLQGIPITTMELGNPNACHEAHPTMEVSAAGQIILTYPYCIDQEQININDYRAHMVGRIVLIDPETMVASDYASFNLPQSQEWLRNLYFRAVIEDQQHNILVLGGARLHDQTVPNKLNIITKFDAQHQIIWQQEYYTDNYSEDPFTNENLFDIIQTPDGGYAATGETMGTSQDHWLLKLDACGYEVPSGCPPVVGVAEQQPQPTMQLWPNPFHFQLKAVLPNNATSMSIIDATGRIVFEEQVFYPNQTWNLSSLSDGVYVMSVELESGIIVSERIVKR